MTNGGGAEPARMERLAGLFERELDRYLAWAGAEGVENLHDAMRYALGADADDPAVRGKRIRPLLCLLTAEALGADPADALPFALAIELMHNFALVHDDIEDGDVMRRGRGSAWVKYGLAQGINIGDYLLVHTVRALAEAERGGDAARRLRLVALIGSALDHTHIGQALDMNARGTRSITIDEYLRIVREKTGYYLAAPIQGGAIVAGADEQVLARIGAMAQFLGPLFQIIDDVIDLTEGKGRDAVGSDIREGKRSYLVAWTAERCTDEERERLFDILDAPREATTAGMVAEAASLFGKYSAMEAGRVYCNELFEESRQVLATLPAPLADALGPLLEQLARRKH